MQGFWLDFLGQRANLAHTTVDTVSHNLGNGHVHVCVYIDM